MPAGAQQLSESSSVGRFTIQMTPNFRAKAGNPSRQCQAAQVQAALDGMDPSVQATVTGMGTTADRG